MALTKTTINDKIEVINSGDWSTVQVRTATIISEDGTEISRNFHRHVVMPNADLTAEDADVSAICTPVFTDAVKSAYTASLTE
tara:strand:+ start:879 stop:1127 length:249 start_codon:yes stop_codon:yes gene_type:complete